jgi:hypothetical protein
MFMVPVISFVLETHAVSFSKNSLFSPELRLGREFFLMQETLLVRTIAKFTCSPFARPHSYSTTQEYMLWNLFYLWDSKSQHSFLFGILSKHYLLGRECNIVKIKLFVYKTSSKNIVVEEFPLFSYDATIQLMLGFYIEQNPIWPMCTFFWIKGIFY